MEGFFIFAAFVVLAVAFMIGWHMFRNYVSRSADTPYYNPYKTYFTVPMTQAQVLTALNVPFSFNGYTSEYIRDEGILKFRHQVQTGIVCEYRISLSPMGQYSVLTATPVIPALGKYGMIDLETFFVRKLGASKINSEYMRPHV